jgi:hypothetical protein
MADSIISSAKTAIRDGRIEDMEGEIDDYIKNYGPAEEILIPLMRVAIQYSNVAAVTKLIEKGYDKSWKHPFGDDGVPVTAGDFAKIQKTTDPSDEAQADFDKIITLLGQAGGRRSTKRSKSKKQKTAKKSKKTMKSKKSKRRH